MISEDFRHSGGMIILNRICSRSDSLYAEEEIPTFSSEMMCFSFYVDSQGCITKNSQNIIFHRMSFSPKKGQASREFTDYPSTVSTDH